MQAALAAPNMDGFSLKANATTQEVTPVMEVEDGAVLEVVIKLSASHPLKEAEVSCRRRVCSMMHTDGAAALSVACHACCTL